MMRVTVTIRKQSRHTTHTHRTQAPHGLTPDPRFQCPSWPQTGVTGSPWAIGTHSPINNKAQAPRWYTTYIIRGLADPSHASGLLVRLLPFFLNPQITIPSHSQSRWVSAKPVTVRDGFRREGIRAYGHPPQHHRGSGRHPRCGEN